MPIRAGAANAASARAEMRRRVSIVAKILRLETATSLRAERGREHDKHPAYSVGVKPSGISAAGSRPALRGLHATTLASAHSRWQWRSEDGPVQGRPCQFGILVVDHANRVAQRRGPTGLPIMLRSPVYSIGRRFGSFSVPSSLAGGSYELRLLAANGYSRLATSNTFSVPH